MLFRLNDNRLDHFDFERELDLTRTDGVRHRWLTLESPVRRRVPPVAHAWMFHRTVRTSKNAVSLVTRTIVERLNNGNLTYINWKK